MQNVIELFERGKEVNRQIDLANNEKLHPHLYSSWPANYLKINVETLHHALSINGDAVISDHDQSQIIKVF